MAARIPDLLPVLPMALLFVLSLFPDSTTAQNSPLSFTDKTLVAWVTLGGLSQKGGGVLSLEYPRGTFDAIVLGEIKAARWMAGSNGFARTQQDQKDYPAETISRKDLIRQHQSLKKTKIYQNVQLALVYKGKQITIYRDRKLYAQYSINSEPVTFTRDTIILLGRRHIDDGSVKDKAGSWNDPCLFRGSIDDARIYAQALDAKTIASLKPNVRTGPEPLAWWSFENGRAEDHMNTFGGTLLNPPR